MAIKHTKVSAKSDTGDATLVQASDWNASHTIEAGSIGTAELATGAASGGFPSFILHAPDIVANTSGKAFALPPSPPIATGFSGRIPTVKVSTKRRIGYVTISQLFWQSGAFNTGTITIKLLINGTPHATTLAIVPATSNPVVSSAWAAVDLAAGDTLGWTADFSADLDAAGLQALLLVPEVR